MKHKHCLLLIVSLTLISGCAGQRITPEARARLTHIQVNPVEGDVSYSGRLPPEYEVDQGNIFLSYILTAPIGLIVEAFKYPATQAKRAQKLKQIFHEEGIDVPAIVSSKCLAGLDGCDIVPATSTAEVPRPVLTLTVNYGLESVTFMGEGWTPWLEIEGELKDEQGNRIWKKTTETLSTAELPFPDPFIDTKLIRRLFERACTAQIDEMMRDLNGEE